MTFKRAEPRVRQYEGNSPSIPRAPRPVIRVPRPPSPMRAVEPKTPDRKSQPIRDSARGEECTVRIVGACTFDPATTIWSHAPLHAAGKGGAIKSFDLCGAFCCTACDAVIDGQRPLPPGASRTSVMLDFCMGHFRSLLILRQKGLI